MTVQDLIDRTLRLIGVIASGESPTTTERNDAFAALNAMLLSWNAEQVTLFSVTLQTVTLTGAASYPLATRPRRIKSAAVTATGGGSRPPLLVDAVGWSSVQDKTRTGLWAEALYCDYAFPTANVYLSPKPAGGTLEIYSYTPLTAFSNLSSSITLPDGYERALTYALAVEIAPEYGRTLPQEVVAVAGQSKQAITALNALVLGEAQPGAAASAQPAA